MEVPRSRSTFCTAALLPGDELADEPDDDAAPEPDAAHPARARQAAATRPARTDSGRVVIFLFSTLLRLLHGYYGQ